MEERLNPRCAPFNLDYLVAFGTQCTCYISQARREGGKHPDERRSFKGMVIGYIDMPAYKVYDFETRKRREVSFTMTYIHEGYYPYLQAQKEKVVEDVKEDPHTFFPTREAALDPEELQSYNYSPTDDRAAWASKET